MKIMLEKWKVLTSLRITKHSFVKKSSVIASISNSHGNEKAELILDDGYWQYISTNSNSTSRIFNLATLNLNGDYADAAAAIVGGLGMAPGANIGDNAAIFEATHGTAPKHAGLKINQASNFSGVMMLEYFGMSNNLITKGLSKAIEQKKVTYDLHV